MPGTTLNVTDIVKYKGEMYRVARHKKRVEDNWPDNPYDLAQREPVKIDDFILDFLELERLNEKLRREEQGLPCSRRYRFQTCRKEESTHVELYGLLYPTVAIEEVAYEGPISWSPELIAESQAEAVSYFSLIDHPFTDWYWE